MKRLPNSKQPLEGEFISGTPPLYTPKPVRLTTVRHCRAELARVYNDARHGLIETSDASRLAFVLTSISKMLEAEAANLGTTQAATVTQQEFQSEYLKQRQARFIRD